MAGLIDFRVKRTRKVSAQMDAIKLSATSKRGFTTVFRGAIKAFITAAADRIHVDTGMSLASLIPLARELRAGKFVEAQIAAQQKNEFRLGYTDMNGVYHANQERSPEHGESLGEDAYAITIRADNSLRARFMFKIPVFQYSYHEDRWQSILYGRQAALEYLVDNFHRYVKGLSTFTPSGTIPLSEV